ncbi:hypothetical protein V1525DRAFT_281368 [Lipomyces kononenkoae]|uniref:Uncharacterized protein n=1 Tax=Lipomyces kononenkoae TaxID=34357 RepID=A0ACC3SUB9_LIPKO
MQDDIEALARPRPRVRSGCITCRRRKVKCDEQRPHCYNCTRLKRTCIYEESSNSLYSQNTSSRRLWKRANSTTTTTAAGTAAFTTPAGASPSSLSLSFISTAIDLEGWTASPSLMEFDANGEFTVREQANRFGLPGSVGSPLLSWSQAPLLSDSASLILGPATPPVLNNTIFSYFLERVEPPFIAKVDALNWKPMKKYIVDLGCRHTLVSQAISAVESLYRAKANHDDIINSTASYYAAKSGYASMLERGSDDPETVLVVTFLLCCFEIVAQHETVSITLEPEGALVAKLEAWQSNATSWSPGLCRLQAWFQILHARALHLGGRGLLSPKIASLNRHHRSRGFQTDEREVEQVAENIKETLHHLWSGRPALLRTDRRQLQNELSPGLGSALGQLVDLCNAAYFTEVIYLGRAYGKSPTASAEELEAMQNIRHIVESRCEQVAVDPSFIWPLFMYAVEHPDPDQSRWAVGKLREVKDPIWHSDFVSSLAQGISEEQLTGAKRVDTRYFCLQRFSIPPPFI